MMTPRYFTVLATGTVQLLTENDEHVLTGEDSWEPLESEKMSSRLEGFADLNGNEKFVILASGW